MPEYGKIPLDIGPYLRERIAGFVGPSGEGQHDSDRKSAGAMPELPEVETMRRHLLPLVGARIVDITRPRSKLRPIKFRPSFPAIRRTIVNGRISSLDRLGKRLLINIDCPGGQYTLVFEPRMTGLVTLCSPPDQTHLRMVLTVADVNPKSVYFWDARGLSILELRSAEAIKDLARRLGPDALTISAKDLQARLGKAGRPIKTALMDQQVIAGIGNLYASEILFAAQVHPATPCRKLTEKAWRAIVRAIRRVLLQAIAAQGSTLGDGTYRNPQGEAGRYQFSHYVYQKDGELCRRCCRAVIARMKQAGRSTFYCPVCQPAP